MVDIKDEVTKKRVEIINEAGRNSKTLLFGFLATCAYFGVAVASTSDRDLLIGRHVLLPVLGAQIPIRLFFVVAPLLVVALHFYSLLNEYFLSIRLDASGLTAFPERTLYLEPSLLVTSVVDLGIPQSLRWTLQILSAGVLMFLPGALLVAIQIRFVAYHEAWITALHQIMVLVDLGMLWWLVPMILRHRSNKLAKGIGILLTAFAFTICGFIAVGPGNGFEFRTGRVLPFDVFLHRNIEVSGGVAAGGSSLLPVLTNRDFRRANLKGVTLAGADLRDADLRGACLEDADLRRADLRGANLSGADLTRARLDGARLEHSEFRLANLKEALVRLADLSSADFRDASLSGAKLSFSRLAETDLAFARMTNLEALGTMVGGSSLLGADLQGAKLWAVEMQATDIRGSSFLGAELWASHLDGLSKYGPELERSVLISSDPEGHRQDVEDALRQALGSTGPLEQEWIQGLEAKTMERISQAQSAAPPEPAREKVKVLASRMVSTACRSSALAQSLFRSVVGCQNPFDDAELQRTVAEQLLEAYESERCPGVGVLSHWSVIEMIVRGEDAASVSKEICVRASGNEGSSCRGR